MSAHPGRGDEVTIGGIRYRITDARIDDEDHTLNLILTTTEPFEEPSA